MKDIIFINYNLKINNFNKVKNNYYFFYNNESYLFYEVFNDIQMLKFINNYIKKNNIEAFDIILNNQNEIITKKDNKNYALLKLSGILKYEVKVNEFKYYPIEYKACNWGVLWGKRIDYYEIQLRELGIEYQSVLNSYGFFCGLAENAILYYNLTLDKFKGEEEIVSIVHNRMKYPCYLIDYNNPLNFVIDYSVRDIAEYIKSYLLSEDFELENVFLIIDKLNMNNLSFNLLFSRLLYPTFYFDVYDKIILEDGVDNDIISVVTSADKYVDMLNRLYLRYNIKYQMFNVEWLNKKM